MMMTSGFVELVFIGLWLLSIVIGDVMDKGKLRKHTEQERQDALEKKNQLLRQAERK
ncbi:MAG: hypothetical protein VB108_01330 [Anaerolineaceae bacterium]|nr:hypothetical protein [Anaerolineaceae bacterium]